MLEYIRILFSKNNDLETEKGRSNERIKRIMLGSIMAIIHKGITMLTPLITIRITFNYLGQEVYGLWNAIITFFSLFAFADLGLGNGVQTELSRASGKENSDDVSRKIITSAFLMLILVASVIFVIFLTVYPLVDWASLINATSDTTKELAPAVIIAIFIPRLLNIPLSLVQRTQLALQDSYNSYIWQIIGSLLSLISIVVIAQLDLGSIVLIFASSITPVLVVFVNLIFYFTYKKKNLRPSLKYFDKTIMTNLLKTGTNFLGLSVLTTIGLSLDNYIVATVISLDESAIYSILFKIIHMISTLSTMITSLMWGANGEAMGRGDYGWVKETTRKVASLTFLISVTALIFIVFLIDPITHILTGNKLSFSFILVIGMCIFELLLSVASPYFMILNASNNVRIQIILFSIYTPLSFILKYYLANHYGVNVIPWVAVVTYSIVIVPWIIMSANKILDKGLNRKRD